MAKRARERIEALEAQVGNSEDDEQGQPGLIIRFKDGSEKILLRHKRGDSGLCIILPDNQRGDS